MSLNVNSGVRPSAAQQTAAASVPAPRDHPAKEAAIRLLNRRASPPREPSNLPGLPGLAELAAMGANIAAAILARAAPPPQPPPSLGLQQTTGRPPTPPPPKTPPPSPR